jgi:hypothetical protein
MTVPTPLIDLERHLADATTAAQRLRTALEPAPPPQPSSDWTATLLGCMDGQHEALAEDFGRSWNFYDRPVRRPDSGLRFGTGITAWCHADQIAGETGPSPVRIHRLWLSALRASDRQWVTLQDATDLDGGVGDYSTNTFSAGRMTPVNGVETGDPSIAGYLHAWPRNRAVWNADLYVGCVVGMLASGRGAAGCAADLWLNRSNGFSRSPTSNIDIGIGKLIRLGDTPRYAACVCGSRITPDELRRLAPLG